MNTATDLLEKIKKSKNIIITSHINPDGDAIGASLALFLGLNKWQQEQKECDIRIRIVLQDKNPDTTNFLPQITAVEIYQEKNSYKRDLFICVDSADLKRTGKTAVLAQGCFVVNIDHHSTNQLFGDFNYVQDASSSSEIIFHLLSDMGIQIDTEIGECLYTGLINDTGNFSHDNVSQKTFAMAGALLSAGVNNAKITQKFLQNKSFGAMKLIGEALTHMKFYPKEKLIYFYLPYTEMIRHQGRKEDTESIVERLIEYEGAEVSLFLREEEDGSIKGSMRSKTDAIVVSKIALTFGGGGHKKAAGFSSQSKAEEILENVQKKLQDHKKYS
jgi:phosphoesterase RecJ-like protein